MKKNAKLLLTLSLLGTTLFACNSIPLVNQRAEVKQEDAKTFAITNESSDVTTLVGLPTSGVAGEEYSFIVSLKPGYHFNDKLTIKSGEENVAFTIKDGKYTFIMPEGAVSIKLDTAATEFTIYSTSMFVDHVLLDSENEEDQLVGNVRSTLPGTKLKFELKNSIKDNTILVSIMAVNNEVGCIEPIEEIGKLLKNYPKIHFHVDATQAIGKIKINYDDVDLITLSGHKIHSFKASGLLIKRHNTNLEPLITGGGHQHNLRSGTTSVPIEVSLAKAIRLSFTNLEKNYLYVKSLQEYFFLQGSKINNLKFNSTLSSSPYIISFYTNKKASVVAEALSNKEIYVSTKSACSSKKESSSYVLEAMHKDKYVASNSIRVSFDEHNTKEEIDIFFKELEHILKTIK